MNDKVINHNGRLAIEHGSFVDMAEPVAVHVQLVNPDPQAPRLYNFLFGKPVEWTGHVACAVFLGKRFTFYTREWDRAEVKIKIARPRRLLLWPNCWGWFNGQWVEEVKTT